jgi:hypothetical protein
MNNDDTHQSADDALEPQDNIFNPHVNEEHLPEDNDSPAAPADDNGTLSVPVDDPRTDSGIDADELYSEGLDEATGAHDSEIGPDDQPRPLEPEDEA